MINIAVNHLSVLGVVSSDHPPPDLSNSDFLMSGSQLSPARPAAEIINVEHWEECLSRRDDQFKRFLIIH